jgi:septum formation protein
LLSSLCSEFQVVPADIDETLAPGPLPQAVARLALDKARAVAARLGEGVILGADTVVVVGGDVLGKPADAEAARAMLRRLRAREHEVVTGVAVVNAGTGRQDATAVVSRVRMADYDEAAIDAYVATGEPLDKAGAYAIQGRGGALVAELEGSFSNVVGLPLEETARLLAAFGVPVSVPPASS